jgi:hypothetical protein
VVAEQQTSLASQAQQLQALQAQLAAPPGSSLSPGARAPPLQPELQGDLALREAALRERERQLADIQSQLRGEAERLGRTRDALARDRAELQVCCGRCAGQCAGCAARLGS